MRDKLQFVRETVIKATEQFTIGGLKFSDEQALVRLPAELSATEALPVVLSALLQQKINLPFFCVDHTSSSHAGFCVAREDLPRCRAVLEALTPADGALPDVVDSVGTLTLFPHQGKLAVLGRLLGTFGRCRLSLLSLCSSLSGLAVNTGYRELEAAAAALQEGFVLPDNHAPFRSQPEVCPADGSVPMGGMTPVETAASYWEPVIRIYGITRLTGLTITTVVFSEAEREPLGAALQQAYSGQGRFDLAIVQRTGNGRLRLTLFGRMGVSGSALPLPAEVDRRGCDLFSLHGPHFQDRYGIAHAAVNSLHNHGVAVRAVGCTGASVYLAVSAQAGDEAARALTDVFIVPKV